MANIENMETIIDYLGKLLGDQFSRDVSYVYFGDIGVYLPSAFGASRREQKAVIALSPVSNRVLDGQRVAAFENREIEVNIIVMVNITPFFEASPAEAYGERKLVQLATQIATFLTQEVNVTLGGRAQHSNVENIDWAWSLRGDQSIRAAAIRFTCRIRVPRNLS